MQDTPQYVSLANKYRPQTFEDMVGQESISKTLKTTFIIYYLHQHFVKFDLFHKMS